MSKDYNAGMTRSELKAMQEMEMMLKESERSRHLKYQ